MMLEKAIKVMLVSLAIALLCFFAYGQTLFALLKFIAMGIGAAIAIIILYPYLRGVKKGDKVIIVPDEKFLIPFFNFGEFGIAQNDAKRGQEIRVKLENDREIVGIVEEYESFFNYAKVKIIYEEREV